MKNLKKILKKKNYLLKLCLTIAGFVCIPLIFTQFLMLEKATKGYTELNQMYILENMQAGMGDFVDLTRDMSNTAFKISQDVTIRKAAKSNCSEYGVYDAALAINDYSTDQWIVGVWFDNNQRILFNGYHKTLEQFCDMIAGDNLPCMRDMQLFLQTSEPKHILSTADYSEGGVHNIIYAKRISFLTAHEKDATVFFVLDQKTLEQWFLGRIHACSSVALLDSAQCFLMKGIDFTEDLCKDKKFQEYLNNKEQVTYTTNRGGRELLVYKYQELVSGYTCLISVFTDTVEAHVHQYVTNIRNIILASIILMGILLFVTININYKPIKRLANKHEDKVNSQGLSELELLDSAFYATDQKMLNQNKILINFLLSDLLNGRPTDEKLLEESIPGWREYRSLVIGINGPAINSVHSKAITDFIKAKTGCDSYITGITYRPQILMVCIFEGEQDWKAFQDSVIKIINEVTRESYTITVGSIVDQLTDIRSSYLKTQAAFQKIEEEFQETSQSIADAVRKFGESIYAGDALNVLTCLDAVESLLVVEILSEEWRKYYCYKLLNVYFNIKEVSHSQKEKERLIGFTDVNHLFVMLRQSVRSLCMQINDNEQIIANKLRKSMINYVDENFNDRNICLAVVADYLETSIYVVSRLFKEVTGRGFKEYITDKRLEYAKDLMQTTDHSMTEVAAMAGFIDAAYFSGLFKSKYGLSPVQYRKKYRS